VGGEDLDVAEAGGGEVGADDMHGALEFVAFAAEMGEEDLPEGVAGDVGEEGGGHLVGEVALAAEDALLERPRAGGAVDEISSWLASRTTSWQPRRRSRATEVAMPRSVAMPRRESAAGQHEADGLVGVVGQRKRQQLDVADGERRAGGEEVPAQPLAVADVARGLAVGVELHVELLAEVGQADGVVGVLVGDADGADLGGVEPRQRHAPQGFARGDAGIDQQRRRGALDVDAVAAAAGGEHADAELGGGGKHGEWRRGQRSAFRERRGEEFSTVWKTFFHSVEKMRGKRCGKNGRKFSTVWKPFFHGVENGGHGDQAGGFGGGVFGFGVGIVFGGFGVGGFAALEEFAGELAVGGGAGAVGVVGDDGQAVGGGFGEAHGAGDERFVDFVGEVGPDFADDLVGEVGAHVEHGHDDALDGQARGGAGVVELADGVEDGADAFEGVVLALHGDEDAVGGAEGVHGEDAEGGGAVDEDEVVAVFGGEGFDGHGQALEIVVGAGDVDFGPGEIDFGGDEVELG
jgi:hypothetical protein